VNKIGREKVVMAEKTKINNVFFCSMPVTLLGANLERYILKVILPPKNSRFII